MVLAVLALIVCWAAMATAYGTTSKSSHLSYLVNTIVERSSSSADAVKSVGNNFNTEEWVQGGFMSLNYYNSNSCNSSSAVIYTGVDLSQCIDDINQSGNSYYFTCSKNNQILVSSYTGSGCSVPLDSFSIPTGQCYPYEYPNDDVNLSPLFFGFSCTDKYPDVPVPLGTFLEAVYDEVWPHNANNSCQSSLMGYVGVNPGKCINLLDMCTILGNFTQLSHVCDQVTPTSLQSTKVSCANNAPTGKTFLDNANCLPSSQIIPKFYTTGCINHTSAQSSSLFCTLTSPPTTDDDTSSSSNSGDVAALQTGAIAGIAVASVAVVAIAYFAYAKFLKPSAVDKSNLLSSPQSSSV